MSVNNDGFLRLVSILKRNSFDERTEDQRQIAGIDFGALYKVTDHKRRCSYCGQRTEWDTACQCCGAPEE